MGFMPGEDAVQLGHYVAEFLRKQSPESAVRALMETEDGFDVEFWRRCAEQVGLQGLAVPAALGGAGAGLVELGVVFEQLGRALTCAPFLSTVALAASALTRLPESETAQGLLRRLAAGDLVATVAWSHGGPLATTVRADGVLDGGAGLVLDGAVADVILIGAPAPGAARPGLFLVPTDAPGLTRERLVSLDSTRKLARLDFCGVAAEELAAAEEGGADALTHALDTATLLLAAEQLGGAQAALDTAVDYARTRVQFGRRIGSFQAVKHRLADMLVRVESARSVVYHALSTVQDDATALPLEASLARSVASDAYLSVARDSLQVHGGLGFTWEHSAHLHLKRAKSSALLFGTSTEHRRRLAGLLDIAAGGLR